MFGNLKRRQQGAAGEGKRKLLNIEFRRFAQLGEGFLNAVTLGRRSRFRIERDLPSFGSRSDDCGKFHSDLIGHGRAA